MTKIRAVLDGPKQMAVAACLVARGPGRPLGHWSWSLVAHTRHPCRGQPDALRSNLCHEARPGLQALLSPGRAWSGHRGLCDGRRLTVSVLEACPRIDPWALLNREKPLCAHFASSFACSSSTLLLPASVSLLALSSVYPSSCEVGPALYLQDSEMGQGREWKFQHRREPPEASLSSDAKESTVPFLYSVRALL